MSLPNYPHSFLLKILISRQKPPTSTSNIPTITCQDLQFRLPNALAKEHNVFKLKSTTYTFQLWFPWAGIFSLTNCNDLTKAISCPKTSSLVYYHSFDDSCNRCRNFEVISTHDAVKPRTYVDTGRKILITTKIHCVWALSMRPSAARKLQLWIMKHNNVTQHSVRAYLPLARCASHAERFERWQRCPDCST